MVNIGLPSPGLPNRGWHVWVIGTVMVFLATVFVTVRIVARYFRSGIQLDDWTILASLIGAISFTFAHDLAVDNGFGRHDFDLSEAQERAALKCVFVAQVLYKVVICLTKVSILLLYLRVFSVARYFSWCCIAMIAFTIVSGIAYLGLAIWQCRPIRAFWDRDIEHVCISNHVAWLSYALINIITDFIILLLPVQQVLRLQLKIRDKVAVIMIFLLGGFVCITSIIRTTSLAASSTLKDVTWNTISVSVWSGVEINTGIICACLPMIRQPLSLLFPNLFSTANRSNPRAGYPLSYAAATRHKTRGDRSLPTGDPDILTWTRNRDDHSFMVSVKPGSRQDKFVRRTESEEEMIGLAPEDLNGIGAGIMKTTNVSISESLRTGYRSSSSHVGS